MQRLHSIDILCRGQGGGKLAEACRWMGVNGDARDGGINIQVSQRLKDGLGITALGKGMHLIEDTGDATGLRLAHAEARVGRPFSHPDLRQGRRRAPLVSETHYLLAHILQQLLSDIASIPHTSHRNPFLGFRPIRILLRH
jgi:hypothetical protein